MGDEDRRTAGDGTSPDVTAVAIPWLAVAGGVVLLVLLVVLATIAESRSVLLG